MHRGKILIRLIVISLTFHVLSSVTKSVCTSSNWPVRMSTGDRAGQSKSVLCWTMEGLIHFISPQGAAEGVTVSALKWKPYKNEGCFHTWSLSDNFWELSSQKLFVQCEHSKGTQTPQKSPLSEQVGYYQSISRVHKKETQWSRGILLQSWLMIVQFSITALFHLQFFFCYLFRDQ